MITRPDVLQARCRMEAHKEQVALDPACLRQDSLAAAGCFPEPLQRQGSSRILHTTFELHPMPQARQNGHALTIYNHCCR